MICLVTSIMLTISGTEENKQKRKELWAYFKENDPGMYRRLRVGLRGIGQQSAGSYLKLAYAEGLSSGPEDL